MTVAETIADTPLKAKQCLGIQQAARILSALREHVHVELTLANVVPRAVQALQENRTTISYYPKQNWF